MAFVPDQPAAPAKSRFVADDPTKTTAYVDKRNLEAKAKPFEPGPLEKVGRYFAGIGAPLTRAIPEGPTGLPLIDAAAGVADFATSAALGIPGTVARLAQHSAESIDAAEGGYPARPYADRMGDWTRETTTPVGRALEEAAGAAFAPIGEWAGKGAEALGLSSDTAAMWMDAAGTAADVIPFAMAGRGLKAGARGFNRAKADAAGVRVAPPEGAVKGVDTQVALTPDDASQMARGTTEPITPNGEPLRPFGPWVERGRRMGFTLTPSQVEAHLLANAPEGTFSVPHPQGWWGQRIGGQSFKPKAIIDNQKKVNRFSATELNISEVTPQGLKLAKGPHNAVLNEIPKALPVLDVAQDAPLMQAIETLGAVRRQNPGLPNVSKVDELRDRLFQINKMPTQQAMDLVKELRKDANHYFQQFALNKSGAEQAGDIAKAYRGAADAFEDAIERQLQPLNPGLAQKGKEARTALAKIHNVEDALDGVNVDPQKLAKMLENGVPLSGYLKEMAEIAREFPQVMQSATGIEIPAPSALSTIWSGSLFGRQLFGEQQGPRVLAPAFQNKYGRVDPTFDPRTPPAPEPPPPIGDYQPPDPNSPAGTPPPGPIVTGQNLDAQLIDPMARFDELPPADARPGDLTAETPPMQGGVPFDPSTPQFHVNPLLSPETINNAQRLVDLEIQPGETGGPVLDRLAGELGLEVPPSRFTNDGDLTMDLGLDFQPDPNLGPVSIVRGGPQPGPVADTPALDQALLDAELRGRPLDPETGAGIAPEDVRQPFTRPAAGLGEDLGTGFGEPPVDPLLENMLRNELGGEFEPGVGPQPRPGFDPYADATDAEIIGTRRPDAGAARPLPAPEGPGLGDELTLAPDMPPPEDFRARYREDGRTIPPGARIIEAETKDGYIAARPMENGDWQIRSAFVKEGSRGKGIGKSNLMKLTREVADEGGVLHSDSKISEGQVGVYRSLQRDGQLEFDGDLDAIMDAMDETGNATNPTGEPWIRNIRLGPAG
jgi:hypothetical protein